MTTIAILGEGMLARRLAETFVRDHLGPNGPNVWMFGHDRFDIRDSDSIVRVLSECRPDVIVNTVALHKLDFCERNADLAFDVNARGAERVATLCPTIYVSTDYVFGDGGPHDESMPGRQPRSVYGRSKLAGELATLEKDGIVVRVSGLYDHEFQSHKGLSFPETMLTSWDTVELPTDQVFSPTYAPDAAARIASLALNMGDFDPHDPGNYDVPEAEAFPRGIYHAANAGSTSWAAFGQEILDLARRRRHIKPVVKHDPIRPANSALASRRLPPLRHWRLALMDWYDARLGVIRANAVSPLRSE